MSLFTALPAAFAVSVLVAFLGYRRGSLTRSGAAAGVVIGTAIFAFGGWAWGVLLGVFFVSSSLLSHYREGEKAAVAAQFDKTHRRDAGQAIANGGPGAVLAVLSFFWPHPLWWAAYIGAMATVTADTWATELGTLADRPPRLVTTGRPVPAGTSGGVTAWGTLVTVLGGLVIGGTATLLDWGATIDVGTAVLAGGLAGFGGAMTDSLMGATVQAIYTDPRTGRPTEKREIDGRVTPHRRGWPWLTNDRVNLLAGIVGAGLGAAVGWGLL